MTEYGGDAVALARLDSPELIVVEGRVSVCAFWRGGGGVKRARRSGPLFAVALRKTQKRGIKDYRTGACSINILEMYCTGYSRATRNVGYRYSMWMLPWTLAFWGGEKLPHAKHVGHSMCVLILL